MNVKFKVRIALVNTLVAALSTLLVFVVVYFVVMLTSYHHLDSDIRTEKEEVFENLKWQGDSLVVNLMQEWQEKEHHQTEVNPTFLQVNDKAGQVVFRSANLGEEQLHFDNSLKTDKFFDFIFKGKQIRQGQFPIISQRGQLAGHLNVAISQVESALVLKNLRITLFFAFLFLVLIFYFGTSLAAARSIAPIQQLIQGARQINDQNISTRLPLPPHQDELFQLATTINELLTRIEHSIQREKQVTADISHELRSPLAGIRGTLEVLLRKKRAPEHYEQKLEQVIQEADKMNRMLDQLLQLAKIESGYLQPRKEPISLAAFFENIQQKWAPLLEENQVVLHINIDKNARVATDTSLLELIIGNLISNALKYSTIGGFIGCTWDSHQRILSIKDKGPGIPEENLPYIFDRFYRIDTSRNTRIPGSGLGLSIAKKLADIQGIDLTVQSREGEGTTFYLQF